MNGTRAKPSTPLDWDHIAIVGIDGASLPSELFKGKVVLVVNTASFCGFTPQYTGLEALWRRYRSQGLVVLGMPSNDFRDQEPKGNPEIKQFCETTYGIDFPLAEKSPVTGAHAHPLYAWAASQTGFLGVPRWNFYKIIIGRDGRLAGWFSSLTTPASRRMRKALEAALHRR